MSLFGYGSSGVSLKALLENPDLQNPPSFNTGTTDLKKTTSGTTSAGGFSSAFLGPNLWERPSGDNNDFDLEYMDLDEFLSENGIPVDLDDAVQNPPSVSLLATALTASPQRLSPNPDITLPISIEPPSPSNRNPLTPAAESPRISSPKSPGLYFPESPVSQKSDLDLSFSPPQSPKIAEQSIIKSILEDSSASKDKSNPSKRKSSTAVFHVKPEEISLVTIPVLVGHRSPASISPIHDSRESRTSEELDDITLVDVPGQDNFNPQERRFTDEELKPQPMIKKSKKVFVPEENKDDKYWNRRKKNNVAAKRSRDARRIKENQIAMRASFLEKENDLMKVELDALREENEKLRKRLAKYEGSQ